MVTKEILSACELNKAIYEEDDARFQEVEDIRFGIVQYAGVDWLVVRGTANWQNALRDIWVRPGKGLDGFWAHRGFISGMKKVLGELPKVLPQHLIVTGHSFGGAVAFLLSRWLGRRCITFGCPRVDFKWWNGDSSFVEHIRVVCDDDAVTMIPRILYRELDGLTVELKDRDGQEVSIKDHKMAVYMRRVRSQYEKARNAEFDRVLGRL